MHIYHASCLKWDKKTGPVPRFLLDARNISLSTRTYKCNTCGETLHLDMNWSEGIEVEPDARLD